MFAKYEKSVRRGLRCELVDIGQFASLPGRGLPVNNLFAVVLPFFLPPEQTVEFVFLGAGINRTVRATSSDRVRWVSPVVNMSEFPATPSPASVSVQISESGRVVKSFPPSLQFSMLNVPWFNSWVNSPRVRVNTDVNPLQYEFSGNLPAPVAFSFQEPFTIPFPLGAT